MGVVLAAEDPRLNRIVAIKKMLPQLASDPVAKERFLYEARAAAQVEHEYLVPIWHIDEDDGVPYIVMPLLSGVPLQEITKMGKPIPVKFSVPIARQVAQGLAAAHASGLIHRDIKPSNIWLELGPEGNLRRVRILDFGLARLERNNVELTRTGQVLGTPAYMAPEQARGLPLDGRADLFSLGVTLYQMLTGRRPFQGESTMALLTAIAVDTPTPVRQLNPTVSPRLEALIDRLLSKKPEGRPATAQEVANELLAIEADLSSPTLESLEPPTLMRSTRAKSKPRLLWPIVAAASVLLIVGFLGILLSDRFRGKPVASAPTSPATTPTTSPKTVPTVPTTKPAVASTPTVKEPLPVKVFVMAGQSNMSGRAKYSTLNHLADSPKTLPLLKKIQNPDGTWKTRDDVWIYNDVEDRVTKGKLSVGYGYSPQEIGPELMFGTMMGDTYENPIVIIKYTLGGLSLAVEGRPPTAIGDTGIYYRKMINIVPEIIQTIPEEFPELAGRKIELVGFVWFQGWNDAIDPNKLSQYESNLTHLIKDIRKDWKMPNLPFVIGEFGIPMTNKNEVVMQQIQRTVVSRPEFQGNVALAEVAKYWDKDAAELVRTGYINRKWKTPELEAQFGRVGSNYDFHYLGSGKIMSYIGQSMADAMNKLVKP